MSAAPAHPFSPRAVLAMLVVGVFSFAAFAVLSTYAPDLRAGRDGRAHALSKSAVGFAGLVTLARAAGVPVVVSRGSAPMGRAVVILTPEPGVDPGDVTKAVEAAGGRPVLLVLPKWSAAPAPNHRGWVSKVGLLPAQDVASLIPGGGVVVRRAKGDGPLSVTDVESDRAPLAIGAVSSPQSVASPDWTPALVDQQGRWLVARSMTHENVLLVADPDLLNTHGLSDLGRARQALLILDDLRGGGPVVFDVTLNGFARTRAVLKLAFEPPFLAATLCALAAALLMGLHAAARFGAPKRAERALALGKTALADNSAALLRLARREPAMAAPYADLVRAAIARAVAAPRALDKAELDAVLDRLAAKAGQPYAPSALTVEAEAATNEAALMAVARKLHDLRRGMTRERD